MAIASYSASAFVSVAPYTAKTFTTTQLKMAEEVKAAPQVTGEELEGMLQEWDMPLVVDAFATWWDMQLGVFLILPSKNH